MIENLINSPFLTSLALTLLHFLWQGLLVATVLKSILLILNNNKPQIRYALSALAMLVNLLLPIITFIIIYQTELTTSNSLVNSLALSELIQELKQPDAFFSIKDLTETLPSLLPYISILWLTTITLLSGKLLIEISTVNKLPHKGTLPPSEKLQVRFNELVQEINLSIKPRLLISLKVEVPMAIGWLKPVVLIPASMISGLNNAQLEMLILHELAHIRRHDYLVNFLQTVIEILLFFHPAVLWVSKQMRNEREYCSDDIAVHHCGDAVAYAHTLADTASLCTKTHNHTIPDMAMAASGGDLKQRVVRLVDHHCAPNNNISKWFASATIIFSVLLLSSKQLLTMPLLDIWYNENPWKLPEPSINDAEKQTVNTLTDNSLINKSLPNSSIAQQLLTPQELNSEKEANTYVNEAQPIKQTNEPVISSVKHEVPLEINTNNLLVSSATENKPTDNASFNDKLDNLANSSFNKPQNNIEEYIASNSSMVEEAFKRTKSNDSYQKQLASLQTNEVTNRRSIPEEETTKPQQTSLSISSNSQHDELKAPKKHELANVHASKIVANTIQNYTDNSFSQEKELKLAEPIWHNAEQLKKVDPVYPSVAKRKGIEIEVKVNFTIDVDGQAKNIQFAQQSKLNYFKSSIRAAIKKWRFLPAKVDNKPVESQMAKVFSFSLQS